MGRVALARPPIVAEHPLDRRFSRRTFVARRPSPAPSRRALLATAAASALILLPLAAVPVVAADHQGVSKTRLSAKGQLPKGLKTVGSFGRGSQTKQPGSVEVMLELDARPAVKAYATGLSKSESAGVAAGEIQTARIRSEQARVVAALGRNVTRGTVLYKTHALYAGVAVRTSASRLSALAALPGVKAIRPLTPKARDNRVTVPLTAAPQSWQATGQTGEGVTIGIIDTGIDFTHADFGGPGTVGAYNAALAKSELAPTYPDPAKVAGGYDFSGNDYNPDPSDPGYQPIPQPDPNPLDCEGHGSHVAGTAGGYGVTADGSTYAGSYDTDIDFASMKIGPGMAPGATLYGLKVFGCEGSTSVVADALDWAADPNGDGDLSDHLNVVNMSLGSDFGSPQDPDAVATNNAALAGISMAVSMGNGGDLFEVGGAPGDAVRSIAVAASDDPEDVYDGIAWKKNSVQQEVLVAQRSSGYDWATEPGITNQSLVTLGDWSQPPSETNNIDGCDLLDAGDSATVDGKVPLLYWTADDSTRRCGSAGRSANVRDAGAVGAVLSDDVHRFTSGIFGDDVIPVMQVNDDGTATLLDALDTPPGNVKVTLTSALFNSVTLVSGGDDDPTDQIADFSSRGTSHAKSIKPDVSAPGVSVFSVAVGSGDDGVSESGTSMAAPHTAGLAALVVDKHPGWTAEEVKAAIMGTADHSVYAEPGQQGQPLGLMRAGLGRIDARAAVATNTLAYNANGSGAVSVSFGKIEVTSKTSITKKITVANKRATSAAAYDVAIEGIDALPGATWSVSPSGVAIPAGGTVKLAVTLTLDPSVLPHTPEPSLDLDPLGAGLPFLYRDWLSVTDGKVVLEPLDGTSGGPVQVGLWAAPRAASTMKSTASDVVVSGSTADKVGEITLKGTGRDNDYGQSSTVSAFELAATSPELPDCTATVIENCIPFADIKAADIEYVGAGSTAPLYSDPNDGMLYFAVASHGKWRTAAGITEFDVLLDLDGDGNPEAVIYNTRLPDTDLFVAETLDLETYDSVDLELIDDIGGGLNTNKMHGNVMTLPVWVGALSDYYGDLFDGTVHYSVESYSAYTYDPVDVVGEDRGIDLALSGFAPAYAVYGDYGVMLNDDQPGATLTVDTNQASKSVDNPQGILLFHHLNKPGKRAEVLTVQRQSKATLELKASTVAKGKAGKATVTVTIPGTSAEPGGMVKIKEGGNVLVQGSVKNGSVTLTVPVLKPGKHTLVAKYLGTNSTAGDTSNKVTLTVNS